MKTAETVSKVIHEVFPILLIFLYSCIYPIVERSPARNIKVFNPSTNTLNVRWEPASGDVQEYRVVYAPLTGTRPSQSVSQTILHICFSSK